MHSQNLHIWKFRHSEHVFLEQWFGETWLRCEAIDTTDRKQLVNQDPKGKRVLWGAWKFDA